MGSIVIIGYNPRYTVLESFTMSISKTRSTSGTMLFWTTILCMLHVSLASSCSCELDQSRDFCDKCNNTENTSSTNDCGGTHSGSCEYDMSKNCIKSRRRLTERQIDELLGC